MKITVRISLLIAVSICFSCSSHIDISGNYSSKAPDNGDKVSLMYSRGDFNFMYTRPGDCKLELQKDSSFLYYEASCNIITKNYNGRWNVVDGNVILHFSDVKREDLTYNVSGKQLYLIQETTILETKQKLSSLTLLEKR